jgi:hypothetical protein
MPNAKLVAGSNRVRQNMRVLRDHWLITEAGWNDAVRQRFEERYLAPLDPAAEVAIQGMLKLAEVLDRVRRDCSDRSDAL